MSSNKLLKLTICGAVALTVSACGNTKVGAVRGNSGSHVTSVNIGLPDRSGLKTQVSDIETKMNAFRLIVKPVGGNCTSPTSIDKVDTYSANPTISASLQQGCDYEVTLELGNRSSSGGSDPGSADKVTYDGKVKTYLETNCISCHAAGQTAISDLTSWSTVQKHTTQIYDRVVVKGDMPKGGSASASDKEMLTEWKAGGYLEKDESGSSNTGNTTGGLTAVYYRNSTAHLISKEEIQGKASYSAKLKIQLQQAGRDIGLGNATIEQPDTGGSTPTPTPEAKPFQLTGERNLSLIDASGKDVALNDLIKGKALILDFSADDCGYCIDEARKLNEDTSRQAKFDDKKCTIVTITKNERDLAAWSRRFAGTYTAKHSYGLKSAEIMNVIKNVFGAPSLGTPTFMVVKADGTVDASSWSNRLDSKIMSACE